MPTRGRNKPCVEAKVFWGVLPYPPMYTNPSVGSNRLTPVPSGRVGNVCCYQRSPKDTVRSGDASHVSCTYAA